MHHFVKARAEWKVRVCRRSGALAPLIQLPARKLISKATVGFCSGSGL